MDKKATDEALALLREHIHELIDQTCDSLRPKGPIEQVVRQTNHMTAELVFQEVARMLATDSPRGFSGIFRPIKPDKHRRSRRLMSSEDRWTPDDFGRR